jgi:cyclase
MLKNRIIPALLLQGGGLVKTQQFKNSKYVGDPTNAIKIFNEKEVDELIVIDIDASKKNQVPNYEIIEMFASECFMPVCYGGGITDIDQAARIFDLGIEKISIQSSVLENFSLIEKIATRFGNQSVVISIDVIKNWLGKYKLYSSRNGKALDKKWQDHLKQAVNAGAGEVLLNSVNNDGMQNGYDLTLIGTATKEVNVPIIALGGAGKLSHFKDAVDAGASAVAAGSMFVFQGPHRAVLITYPQYGELQQLLEN